MSHPNGTVYERPGRSVKVTLFPDEDPGRVRIEGFWIDGSGNPRDTLDFTTSYASNDCSFHWRPPFIRWFVRETLEQAIRNRITAMIAKVERNWMQALHGRAAADARFAAIMDEGRAMQRAIAQMDARDGTDAGIVPMDGLRDTGSTTEGRSVRRAEVT